MKEFFHGWRRKTGGVSLVLALVLWCGWVRSSREFHCLAVTNHIIIQSHKGRLTLFRDHYDSGKAVWWWHGESTDEQYDPLEAEGGVTIDWRRSFAGVTFGAYTVKDGLQPVRTDVYDVRYWSLVLPLTLLSAYLLLWKPRKRA